MITVVEKAVLDLIKSSKDGILQNEIWKAVGIDSRKCSRIVVALEDGGLVKREWEKIKGTRTYRIRYIGTQINYDFLMAGGSLAPCIGCNEECIPNECLLMDRWVMAVAEDVLNGTAGSIN